MPKNKRPPNYDGREGEDTDYPPPFDEATVQGGNQGWESQGGDEFADAEEGQVLSGEKPSEEIAIQSQNEHLTLNNAPALGVTECNYYCPPQNAEKIPESLVKYLEHARKENEEMREFLDDLSEVFTDKFKERGSGGAVLRLLKALGAGALEKKPTAPKERCIRA